LSYSYAPLVPLSRSLLAPPPASSLFPYTPLFRSLRHERSRLGPEPRFRRRARALKREVPRGEPRPPGDRSRADAQLGRVLVATRQDALGKAVRGEEHLHRLGRGESLQGLRYALRDQIQELGMITPAAHQRGLQPTGCR